MAATPVGIGVLQKGFAELYKSSEHADCTIICGSYSFRAHKAVLCSQSKFFQTALKSGTFKEGETGILRLEAARDGADDSDPCDDPEIVKLMIEYFYLFDYGSQHSNETSHRGHTSSAPALNSHLVEHTKVFAMSVKYQAEGLRALAAAKFAAAAATYWHHGDFPAAISVVYNSTTDEVMELRNTVEHVLHSRFDNLKDTEELGAVVRSIPGLAYGLLVRRPRVSCTQEKCAYTYTQHCTKCRKMMRHCVSCSDDGAGSRCSSCNMHQRSGPTEE